MFTLQTLTALLLTAPSAVSAQPTFESEIQTVDTIAGEDSVEVLAYDADGNVIGVVALWVDPEGDVHIDAEFDDGYSDVEIMDGVPHVRSTLSDATLRQRAEALADVISVGSTPQASWFTCAVKTAGTVATCSASGLTLFVGCPAAAAWAACDCLPLMVEKWKDKKC